MKYPHGLGRREFMRTDKEIVDRIGILMLKKDVMMFEISFLRQTLPFSIGRQLIPREFKYKIKKQGWLRMKRDSKTLLDYMTRKFPYAWHCATDKERSLQVIKNEEETVEIMVDPLDMYIGKFKGAIWLLGDEDNYEKVEEIFESKNFESGIAALMYINEVYKLEDRAKQLGMIK